MIKTLLFTNIPAPYRVEQFNLLANKPDIDLLIIYQRENENNRHWTLPDIKHRHFFLAQFKNNKLLKMIQRINDFNPDVYILAGFKLSIIILFLLAKLKRKKVIIFSDSWELTIKNLPLANRILRKYIYKYSDAAIVVSKKGKEYFNKKGFSQEEIFISPLAVDNERYNGYLKSYKDKKYDILFSGQFIERKMPLFIIEVLKRLKEYKKDLTFLMIGSGPMENEIITKLKEYDIDFYYPGFIQQGELPNYYSNSKILLFPTKQDPWGLVANEACAVGTPVITCSNAGVADDLILHDYNGYVLPLDVDIWTEYAIKLLSDEKVYIDLSDNAIKGIEQYSVENAVHGMQLAIKNT